MLGKDGTHSVTVTVFCSTTILDMSSSSPSSLPSLVLAAFPVATGNRSSGQQQLKRSKVFCGHSADTVMAEPWRTAHIASTVGRKREVRIHAHLSSVFLPRVDIDLFIEEKRGIPDSGKGLQGRNTLAFKFMKFCNRHSNLNLTRAVPLRPAKLTKRGRSLTDVSGGVSPW